jgi:hypothetical protein
MGRAEAWLEYLQGLWGRGFLVLLAGCATLLVGLLFVGAPIFAVAWALGYSETVAMDWLAVSALLWFPPLLGRFAQSFQAPPLHRPDRRQIAAE